MLENLKKSFGLANPQVEAQSEAVVALTAALEQSEASVATLTAQLADATEKLASVQDILAKAEAENKQC